MKPSRWIIKSFAGKTGKTFWIVARLLDDPQLPKFAVYQQSTSWQESVDYLKSRGW